MKSARITIAGLHFVFTCDPDQESIELPQRYASFVSPVDSPQPTATYRVTSSTPADEEPWTRVWDSPTWGMDQNHRQMLRIRVRTVPDPAWVTVALLRDDFSKGSIIPVHSRFGTLTSCPLHYPYDQVILVNRMIREQAGVVHGSGVLHEGRAYIFCGQSDTGKTTIAKLWQDAGATLLNDDRMVLRCSEDGLLAGASPWHGEEPEVHPGVFPLGGIFHLQQSPRNQLHPLSSSEGLTRLLGASLAPYYSHEGMNLLMDSWSRIVERIPSCILEFTPDSRAVDACRAEMERCVH